MSEQAQGLALLRQPFPPHQISKLPKESRAQIDERKANRDSAVSCQICGSWHHKRAVHLDYVGHAALTDRLLDADPAWTWEPLSVSPDGLPVMDNMGGMWIKLTVCGVTRLGYGHAGDKQGGDAIKEVIGDALRNAAMRFGAALDLWHKGDLHADEGETKREKDAPKEDKPAPLSQAVVADWLAAINAAADGDEVRSVLKDACERARQAQDRDAYAAFRAAFKKREGVTA